MAKAYSCVSDNRNTITFAMFCSECFLRCENTALERVTELSEGSVITNIRCGNRRKTMFSIYGLIFMA